MIKKVCSLVLFLLFSAVLCADVVSAAVTFDYGGAFRLRQESWNYIADQGTLASPDRDFFRLRTNLWGKVNLDQDVGFYLGLCNEAKYYLSSYKPFETKDSTSNSSRLDEDELVIDNLYFDYRKIAGLPIDIRIGRQNFLGAFGDMFLIGDGTPGDGSRSYYFNAARATWRINKSNSVDLVYISDPETDEYLPSLYPNRSASLSTYINNKRLLNASDEQGAVVYVKSKLNDYLLVEPYYIFKEENSFSTTPKLQMNALGARAVVTVGEWKMRVEFTHEFGEYTNGRDRNANGGYIFLGRKHEKLPLKPEWELGYVYLSGDDPATPKHEGWDPLFSRGPAWNEIAIYPQVLETIKDSGPIPGYWTNLHLYMVGVKLALASATTLAVSYQYLKSDQVTSGLTTAMFSNASKERGQVATLMLRHSFTKHLDGFLQQECFIPGDFYNSKTSQTSWLSRWELQYKF